jgi:hypothetical protein
MKIMISKIFLELMIKFIKLMISKIFLEFMIFNKTIDFMKSYESYESYEKL